MELLYFFIYIFDFYEYDIMDNTFSLSKLFSILGFWIFLSIGVGASALLSQQIINHIYSKYIERMESIYQKTKDNIDHRRNKRTTIANKKSDRVPLKENENENDPQKDKKQNDNNRFYSFFLICLVTIIGYFLKYGINVVITNINETKIDDYMEIAGCFNDTICYDNILSDTNLSMSNYGLFYDLTTSMYKDGRNNFIKILCIYGASILASLIIYTIFGCIFTTKKEEVKVPCKDKYCDDCCNNDSYKVYEICGFSIYCENRILERYHYPSCCCCCCECFKLCCCTSSNCFCMIIYSFCYFLRELICPCINDEDCSGYNEADCRCGKEDDYDKKREFFCYCYESKRWQNYIYRFLTSEIQSKIFPYMIQYFVLQIMTLAFEKQYLNFEKIEDSSINQNSTNDTIINNLTNFIENNYFINESNNTNSSNTTNKADNDFRENIITGLVFLGTFYCYFYFTLTFHVIFILFLKFYKNNKERMSESRTSANNLEDSQKFNKNNNGKFSESITSAKILKGSNGILMFNGLYALIFSSLYLVDSEHYFFKNIHFYLVPILMNKFYYFTLNYYCISYAQDKKSFDVVSGQTLISVYLFLWDFAISFIRETESLSTLYLVQLIFSCLPCVVIAYVVIVFLFYMACLFCIAEGEKKCKVLCICIFGSLSFLCIGFCANCLEDDEKCCECNCECCRTCGYCCFDCLDCLGCYDCFGDEVCSCCTCITCYDCCDICVCCHCCEPC